MLIRNFNFTLNPSVLGVGSLMLALLGLLASGRAQADWTKFDSVETGTYYLDMDTVKKSGYIRSFWSILDYRLPQKPLEACTTNLHAHTWKLIAVKKPCTSCLFRCTQGPCWQEKSLTRRASCAIGSLFRQTRRWKNFTEWCARANGIVKLNKPFALLSKCFMA